MVIKISIESVYDLAVKIAEERHNQKKTYKSHLKLSDNYELVGVLGEMVFSLLIQEKMDVDLKENGDDGFDFKSINIKSSEEHKAKHLIEFVDKKFDGYYVFIILNLEGKYGYVKGFIHSKIFREIAEIKNFGYGDRLSLELCKLNEWVPLKPLELNNIYRII